MMERDPKPLDLATAREIVPRVIREIDETDNYEIALMITDMMCLPWPTRWTRDQ